MTTVNDSQTNLRAQQTWRYPLAVPPLSTEAVDETAPRLLLECFPAQNKTPFVRKYNC